MTLDRDLPIAVDVEDLGDRLRITRRWFYWTSIPLGLLALVWIGLTICKNKDSLLNIFSLLFLGLGLLILYVSVLSLTNSTEIEVSREQLSIRHGPLPTVSKKRTVAVRDIDRLYVKTIRTSGNLAGMSRSWELRIVDPFGDERILMGALPDWDQAQFIKQEIEHFLSRVRLEEEQGG